MKKIALFLIVLIGLITSCTTTKLTVSPQQLNRELSITMNKVSDFDTYNIVGENYDHKVDLITTGATYSRYSGFTNLFDNKESLTNSYAFRNNDGDNILIDVRYGIDADRNGKPYAYNIHLSNCRVDNSSHYSAICGANGFTKNLRDIKPEQKSVFTNMAGTYGLIIGICVLLLMLPVY